MKTWNAPEISELNIAETAGLLDGLKEFGDNVNWDGQVTDWNAVGKTILYASEETAGYDFNGDGYIGRPTADTNVRS